MPVKSRWSETPAKKWLELGVGAEGGTLPPSARSPPHTRACTLPHTLVLSVRPNFRQTTNQFAPCSFAYSKSVLPFLDQHAEVVSGVFISSSHPMVTVRVRCVLWLLQPDVHGRPGQRHSRGSRSICQKRWWLAGFGVPGRRFEVPQGHPILTQPRNVWLLQR